MDDLDGTPLNGSGASAEPSSSDKNLQTALAIARAKAAAAALSQQVSVAAINVAEDKIKAFEQGTIGVRRVSPYEKKLQEQRERQRKVLCFLWASWRELTVELQEELEAAALYASFVDSFAAPSAE